MKKILVPLILAFFIVFCMGVSARQYDNSQVDKTKMTILDKLLADGSTAPNISGRLLNKSNKISFNSVADFDKNLKKYQINFSGKNTVILFWSMDDKYSRLCLPKLEKIYQKYKKKGVQVFTINTNDIENKDSLINFLNSYNNVRQIFDAENNTYYEKIDKSYFKSFSMPLIFAEKIQKTRYGVTAFPATFVINKKGLVYTGMVGFFEEYDQWLGELLDDLLKK